MAYRFKLDEPIRHAFQRIGVEQIERAESELVRIDGQDSRIHESRKCFKRMRALLRLVRPGLPAKEYSGVEERFRQIGALLSEARDNEIMLHTITKLEAASVQAPLQGLKRIIHSRRGDEPAEVDPGLAAAALNSLKEARDCFTQLKLAPAKFTTLRAGLERSYGHGRRAFKQAYTQPSDEAFHDLRKRVQQHWRHMQLLQNAWPDYCAVRVAAARELSQILGEDHDLAVLKASLKSMAKGQIGPLEARTIRRAIRETQDGLRAASLPRARRLFAERPANLGRHVEVLWSSARSMRGAGRQTLEEDPKVRAQGDDGLITRILPGKSKKAAA